MLAGVLGDDPEFGATEAALLMETAISTKDGVMEALFTLARSAPTVVELIFDQLETEKFAELLAGQALPHETPELLDRLPDEHQRVLLEALIACVEGVPSNEAPDYGVLIERIDDDQIDLLARLVSAPRYAHDAAARVWQLDCELALRHARKSLDEAAGYTWFEAAPADEVAHLVDVLTERAEKGRPAWGTRWLVDVLPRVPQVADEVYALLS